nr:hypothetical protein [Escherichia coli]
MSFYRSRAGDRCAVLILWRKLMRDIQMVLERWGAWRVWQTISSVVTDAFRSEGFFICGKWAAGGC